ncbi:MAG: hypothetical protein ABL895_04820 [Cyclobacteriaceae bacterium]
MKKLIIIAVSILAFLLLTLVTLTNHFDGVKNEKQSYVEKLNFQFSGTIDSVEFLSKKEGLIFFHLTNGTADKSLEDKLNAQLKHNGDLRFILFKPNNRVAIITSTADKYQSGDSLYVNTDMDKISIFREGRVISENKVTEALNGRPF